MHAKSLEYRLIDKGGTKALLGESPFWDPGTHGLWWVDITGKRIFNTDTLSGDTRSWETPEFPGFIVLSGPDRPVVGMQTGIYAFDPENASFERLLRLDSPGCRFNDATVDPGGRLWVSTMDMAATRHRGAVHLVLSDLTLNTVATGLTIPNGLAVDLERGRLFYSDSHPSIQTIWTRSLASAAERPGEAEPFATTMSLPGRPDGAALDHEGRYWIAGVDGAELYIFDLQGELDTVLSAPFRAPTKMSFSGPEGHSIAVTSKTGPGDGGFVAIADIPMDMPAGMTQPFWNHSV